MPTPQAEIKQAGGGAVAVDAAVFAYPYKAALIHQAVVAFQATARAGTKAQKNRARVSGGGRKPWRQKGQGRARAGSIRSPLWRGGGRAFAAAPRNFAQKLNKKMHRAALRSLLSELNRMNRLLVTDDLTIAQPKTQLLVEKLSAMSLDSVLIILATADETLFMASNNIPWVGVMMVGQLDPYNLLRFDKVLMTTAALTEIQEKLR